MGVESARSVVRSLREVLVRSARLELRRMGEQALVSQSVGAGRWRRG